MNSNVFWGVQASLHFIIDKLLIPTRVSSHRINSLFHPHLMNPTHPHVPSSFWKPGGRIIVIGEERIRIGQVHRFRSAPSGQLKRTRWGKTWQSLWSPFIDSQFLFMFFSMFIFFSPPHATCMYITWTPYGTTYMIQSYRDMPSTVCMYCTRTVPILYLYGVLHNRTQGEDSHLQQSPESEHWTWTMNMDNAGAQYPNPTHAHTSHSCTSTQPGRRHAKRVRHVLSHHYPWFR